MEPLDMEISVLRLFPEEVRADIDFAVLKIGTPRLVAGVQFSTELTRATYDELFLVVVALACGPMDDDDNPMPEMLWFEAVADYMSDYVSTEVVDPEQATTDV